MYCVCFKQTISLALHPPIFRRDDTIDGSFTDSNSACYGDQSGGKGVKNGLAVAQIWQNAEGNHDVRATLWRMSSYADYSSKRTGSLYVFNAVYAVCL